MYLKQFNRNLECGHLSFRFWIENFSVISNSRINQIGIV